MKALFWSQKFCQKHFPAMIASVLICDWIQIFLHLDAYYGPAGALLADTTNLPWAAATFLNHFFYLIEAQTFLIAFAFLTLLFSAGILSSRFRGVSAAFTWGALQFWQQSGILYGIHMFLSVACLLFAVAAFAQSPSLEKKFGRIFLSLIYFNAGFAKLMSPYWRNGEVVWQIFAYKLHEMKAENTALIAKFAILFPVLSWMIIILQISVALSFFWPKAQSTISGFDSVTHALSAWLLDLYLFSILMIVLNLAWFANDRQNDCLDS